MNTSSERRSVSVVNETGTPLDWRVQALVILAKVDERDLEALDDIISLADFKSKKRTEFRDDLVPKYETAGEAIHDNHASVILNKVIASTHYLDSFTRVTGLMRTLNDFHKEQGVKTPLANTIKLLPQIRTHISPPMPTPAS